MMAVEGGVGVIAGGFKAGGLRVETKRLAQVLGVQPSRGVSEKRVTDVDETEASLAWDALSHVLKQGGVAPDGLDGLVVAASGADEAAGVLVQVLGRSGLDVMTFPGSEQASARGLAAAMQQAHKSKGPVAFVAVQSTTLLDPDIRLDAHAMMERGAGAVALLLGRDAPVRFTGHNNVHGKKSLSVILEDLSGQEAGSNGLAQVAASVWPAQKRGLVRSLGEVPLASYTAERLGDLGAAGPPAALLQMLSQGKPGQEVALLVPDPDRTQALSFHIEEIPRVQSPEAVLEEPATEVSGETALHVARTWQENAHAEPRGAYVPEPVFIGQNPARLRLDGQKCVACSRLLFPPRERCPECGGGEFKTQRFSGEGHVYAVTKIGPGGAPGEFAPLQAARGAYGVVVVALAEGPRVAAMLTGPRLDGDGVKIGDPVRLVMRLLYVQEGKPRHSFKALLIEP